MKLQRTKSLLKIGVRSSLRQNVMKVYAIRELRRSRGCVGWGPRDLVMAYKAVPLDNPVVVRNRGTVDGQSAPSEVRAIGSELGRKST